MLFSLKFQRDNRQNALAVDPAKRKTGEKGCIFHRSVKMKQPHTITEPKSINISLIRGLLCLLVSFSLIIKRLIFLAGYWKKSPVIKCGCTFGENATFFSGFSAEGLHNWSTLLLIPLEFQKKLCHGKWLMPFSLKFQRNKQQMPYMDSAKGKAEEKSCIFTALRRWNNRLWQGQIKHQPFPMMRLKRKVGCCFV